MIIIGLTGGMGSGKSTVSAYLAENTGIPVIDADKIAHDITEPGQPTLTRLEEAFGSGIIRADGTLDRKKLAGIVFPSQEKKELLDRITHGAIREQINREIEAADREQKSAVILDVPLLMETGMDAQCDAVWVVTADMKVRIDRVSARDNIGEEEINARIARQMSDGERFSRADEIIDNSGDKETLYREIKRLVQKYV